MFGLPDHTLAILQKYFSSRSEIVKVLMFGSRAKGTEQPGSDIDLAIITMSAEDLSNRVKADLEDLPTPYLFDVVDYQRIKHLPLKEHIDRVGKVLFERL